MRLNGKVAVITGAGSGIGAASAIAMAREGARVVVADINEAGAKGVVEQVEKGGGQALAVRADVSTEADNQAIVEKALARWGRLDIFFANAGVPQLPTHIEERPRWRRRCRAFPAWRGPSSPTRAFLSFPRTSRSRTKPSSTGSSMCVGS